MDEFITDLTDDSDLAPDVIAEIRKALTGIKYELTASNYPVTIIGFELYYGDDLDRYHFLTFFERLLKDNGIVEFPPDINLDIRLPSRKVYDEISQFVENMDIDPNAKYASVYYKALAMTIINSTFWNGIEDRYVENATIKDYLNVFLDEDLDAVGILERNIIYLDRCADICLTYKEDPERGTREQQIHPRVRMEIDDILYHGKIHNGRSYVALGNVLLKENEGHWLRYISNNDLEFVRAIDTYNLPCHTVDSLLNIITAIHDRTEMRSLEPESERALDIEDEFYTKKGELPPEYVGTSRKDISIAVLALLRAKLAPLSKEIQHRMLCTLIETLKSQKLYVIETDVPCAELDYDELMTTITDAIAISSKYKLLTLENLITNLK